MNRKGFTAIMSWVVGIFIILFVSLLFLVGIGFISVFNISGSEGSLEFERERPNTDLYLQKMFNGFLLSKVEFGGKTVTIIDLVEENKIESGEASDVFRKQAAIVFDELMPDKVDGWQGAVPKWIRAYERDEEVKTPELSRGYFHYGGRSCKPFNNDLSYTYPYYSKDRKIVLCVMKAYYNQLEAGNNE